MAVKIHPSFAVHPGAWLKSEMVEAHGVLINDLAEAFGVSRQSVSAVLNGRAALSADMAVRFEYGFGIKAETLMRMQARYDLAKAREHEGDLSVRRLIAA